MQPSLPSPPRLSLGSDVRQSTPPPLMLRTFKELHCFSHQHLSVPSLRISWREHTLSLLKTFLVMDRGISIIPSPALQPNATFPVADTPIPVSFLSPTRTSNFLLASPSKCTDSLVIEISTTVTVSHFRRYYGDIPIDTFTPRYVALEDGSLANPPLLDDIKAASIKLAILSALFTFFLFNTFTAARYIYRGPVKNKTLFYLLLCSQSIGLAAIITMMFPFFETAADCKTVAIISRTLMITSYATLMTGILGVKAYRCLNNSRIVAITLVALRLAIFTMLAFDLSRLRSRRRLSAGCTVRPETTFLPILVTLQFGEALFICLCFLRAAWKASRRPMDHGRLSIQPTLDLKPYSERTSGHLQEPHARRGWWDYEPPQVIPAPSDYPHSFSDTFREACRGITSLFRRITFRQSLLGQQQLSDDAEKGISSSRSRRSSVVSRISKYMHRMSLFKKFLQDELLYTAFIAGFLLVTAVLMLVGTARKLVLPPPAWIAVNWGIASLFTMHSFDRVVRRHEQEALLQHPSTWDPIYRAEMEATRALRQDRARRAASTAPPSPRRLAWSDAPSVRIRSTKSILLPSRPHSPFPPALPDSSALSRSQSMASDAKSPISSIEHKTDRYHPSINSPQASPTFRGGSSPSINTESLNSPTSSEMHMLR
ncbi:hypothetical protein BXZ70DRAFT_938071 [Cristinia sonorae]|uniref:G-protein coupled receptors family 3 profile domain-containing protein n=1 Tax=Cristinia sonorae TaxID=1940300 RepID=A0A8K0UNI2_9AGAR|nr:hypothetical protein BXZ70DRAFT_938071 [Cristinia sonorae]